MNDNIAEIKSALDQLDLQHARELLRDELKENPTAEVYYFASIAALNDEQRLNFLEKVLKLDPFHVNANQEMEKLQKASGTSDHHLQPVGLVTSSTNPRESLLAEISSLEQRIHSLETELRDIDADLKKYGTQKTICIFVGLICVALVWTVVVILVMIGAVYFFVDTNNKEKVLKGKRVEKQADLDKSRQEYAKLITSSV